MMRIFHLRTEDEAESAAANQLADVMSDALVRFATTGSPGTARLSRPAFTTDKRETMVFDVNSRIENYPGKRVFEAARSLR